MRSDRPPGDRWRKTALERLSDGRYRYTFKRAWKAGSQAVVLEPDDLLARLCALLPSPRMHMVRYHGVLASRSKLRAEVVLEPPPPEDDPMQLQAELELGDEPLGASPGRGC